MDYSWVRLGSGVGKWSRFNFFIKMLFQGQYYMLSQEHSKIRTCKCASAKYRGKGLNTYAMYLFLFFYIYNCSVFALTFLLCMKC